MTWTLRPLTLCRTHTLLLPAQPFTPFRPSKSIPVHSSFPLSALPRLLIPLRNDSCFSLYSGMGAISSYFSPLLWMNNCTQVCLYPTLLWSGPIHPRVLMEITPAVPITFPLRAVFCVYIDFPTGNIYIFLS